MDKKKTQRLTCCKTFLQALNTNLPTQTHYAIAIIITLEGNEIISTDKSRKLLQVIWLLFSFNENAPSREDGEKLENIGDRLGKKRYFKALVQLGHLRVKDVFVGNISKNCTKIGYINQHHDILFSWSFFYFFCGLSLSFGFSTCCLRNFLPPSPVSESQSCFCWLNEIYLDNSEDLRCRPFPSISPRRASQFTSLNFVEENGG